MLANTITLFRLLLTFGVIALFGRHPTLDVVLIFMIFVIFTLDAVDGAVARRRDAVSETGALLDTVADRIIENTFWIYFAATGGVPVWMPIAVMSRGVLTDAVHRGHRAPMRGWAHAVARSRVSRGLYGFVKMIAFMSLACVTVFKAPVWGKMSLLLAGAAIAFCLLRGVPVLFQRCPQKNRPPSRTVTLLGLCCVIACMACSFVPTENPPPRVKKTGVDAHARGVDIRGAVGRAAEEKLTDIRRQVRLIGNTLGQRFGAPIAEILRDIEHAENTGDLEGFLQQSPAVRIHKVVERSLAFGTFRETEPATLRTAAARCAATCSQLQIATAAAPHIQDAVNTGNMTITAAQRFFRNVCNLTVDMELTPPQK